MIRNCGLTASWARQSRPLLGGGLAGLVYTFVFLNRPDDE
jgi:hypothetical protein